MAEKKEVKQKQPAAKDEYPEFKDDGIKTKVTSLKQKIKMTMEQLRDMATMEVLLQPNVRMKNRLESIKKMSSAESYKIDGRWKTNSPQIHIVGLTGRKLSNGEYEIRFSVYQTDDKGNKKLYEHMVEVTREDGSKVNRVMSAEYKVAYEVIERIKYREPIEREIVKVMEDEKQ